MDSTALQDDEVGQLQALSCPYLAKLHPALLATKLVQGKPRAFGNNTVVLYGQLKLLLACFSLRHVVLLRLNQPDTMCITTLAASTKSLLLPCSPPWS